MDKELKGIIDYLESIKQIKDTESRHIGRAIKAAIRVKEMADEISKNPSPITAIELVKKWIDEDRPTFKSGGISNIDGGEHIIKKNAHRFSDSDVKKDCGALNQLDDDIKRLFSRHYTLTLRGDDGRIKEVHGSTMSELQDKINKLQHEK